MVSNVEEALVDATELALRSSVDIPLCDDGLRVLESLSARRFRATSLAVGFVRSPAWTEFYLESLVFRSEESGFSTVEHIGYGDCDGRYGYGLLGCRSFGIETAFPVLVLDLLRHGLKYVHIRQQSSKKERGGQGVNWSECENWRRKFDLPLKVPLL